MIEQGTQEWHQQRLGKITASRVHELLAKTKSGPAASRENYIMEKALERITGERDETYSNEYMNRGKELEEESVSCYESEYIVSVEPSEFVEHPKITMFGASPDGLVGTDGMIEGKARKPRLHMQYLRKQTVERKTIIQMQSGLACNGRLWCDFISYNPAFPEGKRLWVRRFERDDELISEIEAEVMKANAEIEEIIQELTIK